jgi:hypothetical protein
MGLASGALLLYVRHRGWLGDGADDGDDPDEPGARPS